MTTSQLDRIEAAVHSMAASLRLQRSLLAALSITTTALGEGIMGKIDELETALAAVNEKTNLLTEAVSAEATQVAAVLTELAELRAAAANGGFISAERFDALIAQAQGIAQNLESAATAVSGIAPDAPTA